jgi:hypothetical protein
MKKLFPPMAIWLYLLCLIGLLLHTSVGKEQVLGKYSNSYFSSIVIVTLLFIPFVLLVKFLIRESKFRFNNKRIILSPNKKNIIFLVSIPLLIILTEVVIRTQKSYTRKTSYNKEFQPFLQSKNKKNLGGNYHINSFGFRGDEVTKEKDKGSYRIVILGGSTAYGDGVYYKNTAGKILGDMLNQKYTQKIEVINAGVSGYNSEHSLIDYMTRISEFKPDLVIMWSGVNDMYASCSNPDFFSGPYQEDYSHFLGPISNMVDSYFYPQMIQFNFFTFDFLKTYLYSDFQKYLSIASTKKTENYRKKIPFKDMSFPSILSYQRNLRYFVNAVKSDGVSLIFGNQSTMFEANLREDKNPDGIFCLQGKYKATLKSQAKAMDEFNQVTKNTASENNVQFIDFDSDIPKTKKYFYDDIHWNENGNQLAAKKLYEFIITNNFITSN